MEGYILIPKPKKLERKQGILQLTTETEISLSATCDISDYDTALLLQNEIKECTGICVPISKGNVYARRVIRLENTGAQTQAYTLEITENGATVTGGTIGIFYGIQTMRQMLRAEGMHLPLVKITDDCDYPTRLFYHDVSRGKVPTLETLKEIVDMLAYYKFNQFQLYVEHTFAFPGMEDIWSGISPLSAEEILALDAYCIKRHVELVPSLATFGHLYTLLSSDKYKAYSELESNHNFSWWDRLAHHTIAVSNPHSIDVIAEMLDAYLPLFSSDKVNICADETLDLGTGKSAAYVAEKGEGVAYVDFVAQIVACAKKHKKHVMMWNDVILKHPELCDRLPEDVIMLTWDLNYPTPEEKARSMYEFGREQYVCPGTSTWNRFTCNYSWTKPHMRCLLEQGLRYKAIGASANDWGDYGHVNFLSNGFPSMLYFISNAWNFEAPATDTEISQMLFGNENICALLETAGDAENVCWGDIVSWGEKHFQSVEPMTYYQKRQVALLARSPLEIAEGYRTLCSIREQLLTENQRVNSIVINEQQVSLKAAALMQALFMVIEKYDFEIDCTPVMAPIDLAEELQLWFPTFEKVWRARNKESELFRIRAFIDVIVRYLWALPKNQQ